jgi:hypothetical protein
MTPKDTDPMTKSLRIAALSTVIALFAAPVFADPGGTDPPPPPNNGGSQGTSVTTVTTLATILTLLGA